MHQPPKIDRRVHSITVHVGTDYSVLICDSYFLDPTHKHRGFEFKQLITTFPPVPTPTGRQLTFTEELRGCDSAAYAEADPSVPTETIIRQKMSEAFGGSARVKPIELDLRP